MRCRTLLTLVFIVSTGCQSAPDSADSTTAEEPTATEKPTAMHEDRKEVAVSNTQTLDVSGWDAVLREHVHDGRIDYAALHADAEGRAQLTAFLDEVAQMPESEPLASWLNAYNALVAQFVLERYPLGSVMDVPDFFSELKLTVAGEERSLDDVENRVIRPRFTDSRVHLALNCGAASCPPLPAEAFVQARLDAQLDALCRAGVANEDHVRVVGDRLEVSELFFWFADDFERDAGSVVGWLKRYGGSRLADVPDDVELVKIPYDWKLGSH